MLLQRHFELMITVSQKPGTYYNCDDDDDDDDDDDNSNY